MPTDRVIAAGRALTRKAFPEARTLPVRLERYHGFLFANLDDTAPSLASHFADLPDLTRFRMAELVRGKRIEYDVAANWKLICENYSECYHCAGAHPQLHRISEPMPRSSRKSEVGGCFNGGPMQLREGIETMSMSGRSSLPTIPGLTHEEGFDRGRINPPKIASTRSIGGTRTRWRRFFDAR